MSQSDYAQFGLIIPCHSDADQTSHERRWLDHVFAGRIGSRAPVDPEAEQARLARLAADELLLLGEVRSVKRVWPDELR